MLEAVWKFSGTDWLGMIFGLLSAYYLAQRKRVGFVFGALCGGSWLAFALLTGSIAGVIANVLLIAFNSRGWIRWRHQESP